MMVNCAKVIECEGLYRARIRFTGDILEGDFDFVYRVSRQELRDYLHDRTYYEYVSVMIEHGFLYRYDNGDTEFIADRAVCLLSGSGVDHVVHTYIDRM